MIDLLAAGKAIAAKLAAPAQNPQVIRNQSASPKPVAVIVPANPRNPQTVPPKNKQAPNVDPLDGLELLPDDQRWLRAMLQSLPITWQRELLGEYRRLWLLAYERQPVEHKKANSGRFAANTWIRETLH